MQASRDWFYWAIPCAVLAALMASVAAMLLGERPDPRNWRGIVLVALEPVVSGCKTVKPDPARRALLRTPDRRAAGAIGAGNGEGAWNRTWRR